MREALTYTTLKAGIVGVTIALMIAASGLAANWKIRGARLE